MLGIGLYVHIPFCASKCGYCDFYSVPADGECMDSFVGALLRELEEDVFVEGRTIETVYVGGGTPTILPTDLLDRLFEGLRRVVSTYSPAEFTVESNPGTLLPEKVEILRDGGVNRISLGAQSFSAAELATLQRSHKPEDIAASVDMVRRAGFIHLNLDMIFGVPGQTLSSWMDSIGQAIDLGPDHLACYGLTYEPGTPLYERRERGEVIPTDEGLESEMYTSAIGLLADCGFDHYEISNFARLGGKCLHNLGYWENRPCIGIGPGASSYINGRRWRNVPEVRQYVRRVHCGEELAVDVEELLPRWGPGL